MSGQPKVSPFALNKTIIAIAVAVAVVVVVSFLVIARPSEKVDRTLVAGSTLPPLGALVPSTTAVVRGGDPANAVIVTTSTRVTQNCDSKTSSHSRNGKDYHPCDAGFAVDFPGMPQIESRSDEMQLGSIKWMLFTSTQQGPKFGDPTYRYVALWGDVPGEPSPEDLKNVLDAAVNQFAAKPGKDSTFKDMSALTFKGNDGFTFIQGVTFTNGHRVFALGVAADKPLGLAAELETFGATFQLV